MLTGFPACVRDLVPISPFQVGYSIVRGLNLLEEDFAIPPSVGKDGVGWKLWPVECLKSQSFSMQETHFPEQLILDSSQRLLLATSNRKATSHSKHAHGVLLAVGVTVALFPATDSCCSC